MKEILESYILELVEEFNYTSREIKRLETEGGHKRKVAWLKGERIQLSEVLESLCDMIGLHYDYKSVSDYINGKEHQHLQFSVYMLECASSDPA